MSEIADVYKRRAADAAMSDIDRELSHTPALMANGLPNAAHVYARRRKDSGFIAPRATVEVEIVPVGRRE